LKDNLEPMREAVAKIVFALDRYKTIADDVLPESDKFKDVRDRYQQTFDAFASQLQTDIQRGLDTFGSWR
jgi:hypothetical protein